MTSTNEEEIRALADAKADQKIGKQEFLNQIFGEVGTFIKDYHCVLGGKMMLHGRIYITDRYIMFYSKIFGRQKKVMVPFSQVNSIVQPTGQMFRSIVVEAGTKSYTFHSFWEPEKSFYYVMDAYEKFKATNERTPIKDRPVEIEDAEVDEPEMTFLCAEDSVMLEKLHKKVRVIKEIALPINLHDFFATFVDDGAPHSYRRYHELVNDKDVVMSSWTECGGNEFQRELKFMKPVNLPGLASTRGIKYQQLRRPNECTFVLNSSTRLEDVPSADCFSVDDVLIVHADGSQQVVVSISFEVAFVKSTMMRTFIEGPTEREMKKWLEVFFQHMQDVVAGQKDVVRGRRSSTVGGNLAAGMLSSGSDSTTTTGTTSAPSSDASITNSDLTTRASSSSDPPSLAPLSSGSTGGSLLSSASETESVGSQEGSTSRTSSNAAPLNVEPVPPTKAMEIKQEFLQNTFGADVGTLYKDYQCALVGKLLTQGRIYATDRNILFYSKIFGREKSVMIPFQQVKTIVPPQGVLRSVVIETENKTYTFRSFWEPEKSFNSLEKAWEKAKAMQAATPTDSVAGRGSGNGDKRRYSFIEQNADEPSELDMDKNGDIDFEKYAKEYQLREVIETGDPLPITMSEFLRMFVLDDALYGSDAFYVLMNGTPPCTTPWSEVKAGEYQREVTFVTPKFLITFGNARGVKSQLRIHMGDHGLLLKSSAHLEEVSFATYFTIEEVLFVHVTPPSQLTAGAAPTLTLHWSFEVNLLKGSFVRPLLCTMVAPELRRWLEAHVRYMREAIRLQQQHQQQPPLLRSIFPTATAGNANTASAPVAAPSGASASTGTATASSSSSTTTTAGSITPVKPTAVSTSSATPSTTSTTSNSTAGPSTTTTTTSTSGAPAATNATGAAVAKDVVLEPPVTASTANASANDNLGAPSSKSKISSLLSAIKGGVRATTGGSSASKAANTTVTTTNSSTTTSNAVSISPKGDSRGRSATTNDANAPMEISPVEAVVTPSTDAYPPRPFLFPALTLVLLALVVVIFWWTRWQLHTLQDKVQRIESLLDQLVTLNQQQQQQQQLLSPGR